VALFAVALFAVALFAVVFLAVVFLAVVFLAVVFLAVDFLAVDFLAVVFAAVLFAVVLVPFLFVGMVASLVTLTLGSTCLGDHRRRGDAPSATVISAAEAALSGSLLLAQGRLASSGHLVLAALAPGWWSHPVTILSLASSAPADHPVRRHEPEATPRGRSGTRDRQGLRIAVELPILPARYSRSVFLSLLAAWSGVGSIGSQPPWKNIRARPTGTIITWE
jgi:hypothetical protein